VRSSSGLLVLLIMVIALPAGEATPVSGPYCVPVWIKGSQPGPFQLNVTFNPSLYGAYLAPDLGNLRFEFPNGTLLHAWLESYSGEKAGGPPSSSTRATAWVKLPRGIRGSMEILMVFYPGAGFDGYWWGEAPQLSPTYGEYDNGQYVFDYYTNFSDRSSLNEWNLNGTLPGFAAFKDGLWLNAGLVEGYQFTLKGSYVGNYSVDALEVVANASVSQNEFGSDNVYPGISFNQLRTSNYTLIPPGDSGGFQEGMTYLANFTEYLSTTNATSNGQAPGQTGPPPQLQTKVSILSPAVFTVGFSSNTVFSQINYSWAISYRGSNTLGPNYPGLTTIALSSTSDDWLHVLWFRVRGSPNLASPPTACVGLKPLPLGRSVVFRETGLPSGVEWGVTLGNETRWATAPDNLTFSGVPQGTLPWTAVSPIQYTGLTRYASVNGSGMLLASQGGCLTIAYKAQYWVSVGQNAPYAAAVYVSTSSGWYTAGSTLWLQASAWDGWSFIRWIGSGAGSYSGPLQDELLTVDGPLSEKAVFGVQVKFSVGGSPQSGDEKPVTINGTSYGFCQLPVTILIPCGSQISYAFPPSITLDGSRFQLVSMSGLTSSASGSLTGLYPGFVKANYQTQYYIDLHVSPSGAGTLNASSGWYDAGKPLRLTAVASPGWKLAQWEGLVENGSSVEISPSEPANITAVFYPGLLVEVKGLGSYPIKVADVNGQELSSSQLPLTLYVPSDEVVSYSFSSGAVTSGVAHNLSGVLLDGTAVPSNGKLVVGHPEALVASYSTSYLLTVFASAGNESRSLSRWYAPGQRATISAFNISDYFFMGWLGTGLGSYTGPNSSFSLQMKGPLQEEGIYLRAARLSSVALYPNSTPVSQPLRILLNGTAIPQSGLVRPGNYVVSVSGPSPSSMFLRGVEGVRRVNASNHFIQLPPGSSFTLFLIYRFPTTLHVNVSGLPGQNSDFYVSFTFELTSGGKPLVGQNLALKIVAGGGTKTIELVTGSDGKAVVVDHEVRGKFMSWSLTYLGNSLQAPVSAEGNVTLNVKFSFSKIYDTLLVGGLLHGLHASVFNIIYSRWVALLVTVFFLVVFVEAVREFARDWSRKSQGRTDE